MWDKTEKERKEVRVLDPFLTLPLATQKVSPLRIVPKKAAGKYHLIYHLSYPRGESENDDILDYLCLIRYTSFVGADLAKCDRKSAFCLLPMHPDDFDLLEFSFGGKFYMGHALPMCCSMCCFMPGICLGGQWGHWLSLTSSYRGFISWLQKPTGTGSSFLRSMEGWRAKAYRAMIFTVAPSTRKCYERAVHQFDREEVGYIKPWPTPVDHSLHYGVFLKETGLAVHSIKDRFSALAFTSKGLCVWGENKWLLGKKDVGGLGLWSRPQIWP